MFYLGKTVKSNDGGSSLDNRSYLNVNVHYVDQSMKIQTKVLGVVEVKDKKTAVNYRKSK